MLRGSLINPALKLHLVGVWYLNDLGLTGLDLAAVIGDNDTLTFALFLGGALLLLQMSGYLILVLLSVICLDIILQLQLYILLQLVLLLLLLHF